MNQTTTKYSFTAKWLWLLFLIVIPANIFSFLSNENVATLSPFLGNIGNFGSIICSFTYGIILIKLASEYDYYKTSGICYICSSIISLIILLTNIDGMLLILIGVIFTTIAVFYEMSAHSDALAGINHDLYVKWENLKLCFIICYGAILVCTIFAFILPLISVLIMLIALIGTLIAGIMKFVYLYKSSKVFKKLSEEENVSRETF